MTLALVLLLVALIAWAAFRAQGEYRRFKALTTTEERQARYKFWATRSVVLYTLVPLGVLALVRNLPSVLRYPPQLAIPLLQNGTGIAVGGGIAGGVLGGLLLGALLSLRKTAQPAPMIGDIAALLPQNGAERACGALLSFTAGIGEELLFRLTLPLLLALLGVPPLIAIIVAAVLFGLAHLYQGIAGIVGTMVIGSLLTIVFVTSRMLWLAMAVHTLVDLNGLVLRPWLMARARTT